MQNVPIEIDRDFVTNLTRELIRFRSVNPPGNEGPVAQFFANSMQRSGLRTEVQNLQPERANVIVRLPGAAPGALIFTGHLDVVPPGGQQWDHDPFEAHLSQDRIYGRGSADMKGGLAAMGGALAALAHSGFRPRSDIVIAATAGEEAGMIGAAAMVEARSLEGAAYLVVGEPSDLDVFIAEKGVLWLEISAYGRTAHGSMPDLGVNAVSFLSRLVPMLENLTLTFDKSALLGGPTLSVNTFLGGNKTNVVPDLARIAIDMRTVPGQSHNEILANIRNLAVSAAADFHPDLRVEVTIENDKLPVETQPDEDLVAATVQSVQSVLGRPPSVGGVAYGTDAAALAPGFGIPMVICGPGAPGMAHQPDEFVEVEQLIQASQIYADLAVRLLG